MSKFSWTHITIRGDSSQLDNAQGVGDSRRKVGDNGCERVIIRGEFVASRHVCGSAREAALFESAKAETGS